MLYLAIVCFIWAFSFGLIKSHLAEVDASFVAWARMMLSLLLFLPFLRWRHLSVRAANRLLLIGAVQYGIMYSTYLYAYAFLQAYQVALFTILTPIYVIFINDLYERRIQLFHLTMALSAVLGAAVIRYKGGSFEGILYGFLIMQISNLCFAFGQIEYRRVREETGRTRDRETFALLYLGALLVTTLSTSVSGGWNDITNLHGNQILVLLYLGILPSGIGFFLWNIGAVKTNTGTLAVFNNIKIPLAVAVSLLLFGEQAHIPRLMVGGGIMFLAVIACQKKSSPTADHGVPD